MNQTTNSHTHTLELSFREMAGESEVLQTLIVNLHLAQAQLHAGDEAAVRKHTGAAQVLMACFDNGTSNIWPPSFQAHVMSRKCTMLPAKQDERMGVQAMTEMQYAVTLTCGWHRVTKGPRS